MRLRRNYPVYQIALMCALALGFAAFRSECPNSTGRVFNNAILFQIRASSGEAVFDLSDTSFVSIMKYCELVVRELHVFDDF